MPVERHAVEPPVPVYCVGRYPAGHARAGQFCRNPRPIATLYGGPFGYGLVRDHGREHVVISTTCPTCGTLRRFAGGVPEELGGSSGYYADGELRKTRKPAA